MAIEYKDYYEILEIRHDAGEQEIRRAFRRLAGLYHPDKAGNDARAEDRFKEINEAYEVLGDPAKRRRYDEFNSAWRTNGSADDAWREFGRYDGADPGRRAEHFTFSGGGFSEFFDQLFTRKDNFSRPRPRPDVRSQNQVKRETTGRGDDLESDLWLTLEEVTKGGVRPITIRRAVRCATCYGMGRSNAHPCEPCDGKGSLIRTDNYKVNVPKGIREGAFLRIAGQGEEGIGQSPAGDLFVKVHYARHRDFRVESGVLHHDLELAPWEAVLGSAIVVPTLDGRATIKIPSGTQNGHKLRLRGRGLPSEDGMTGDLIVNIKVQVPAVAAARERQLWEELARASGFNPRDN